jgi:hypothetical protein
VVPGSVETTPCIAIRFEEQLNIPEDLTAITDKSCVTSFMDRNLNVRVTDFKLPSVHMSTLIGLVDLAEDEIVTEPLPMTVELKNINLTINDDRPPVNITSPGAQPIKVAIGKMSLIRDDAGVFVIQPMDVATANVEEVVDMKRERDREVLSIQLVMKQMKMDNDVLRKQLMSAEKLVEVNR